MIQQLNYGRGVCLYQYTGYKNDQLMIQNCQYKKSFYKDTNGIWRVVRKRKRPFILEDINFKIVTLENGKTKVVRFLP